MMIPLALFVQLTTSCEKSVAVETMAAIAKTESGFDDATLHDNTSNQTYHPRTPADAIALATELIVVDHHSVDLGLMQINSANLPVLGLTIADAFDACHSLAAGARVLAAGYSRPAAGADDQPALAQALSRYNTGNPDDGIANGYVRRVQASAEVVVPALRLKSDAPATDPASDSVAPVVSEPLPPLPPAWDVYRRVQSGGELTGVVVFGAARQAPATNVARPIPKAPILPPAPPAPVQLRALTEQASNDVRP